MMKAKTAKVTITIDEELIEAIRVACFDERLTRSAWMRDAASRKLKAVAHAD